MNPITANNSAGDLRQKMVNAGMRPGQTSQGHFRAAIRQHQRLLAMPLPQRLTVRQRGRRSTN